MPAVRTFFKLCAVLVYNLKLAVMPAVPTRTVRTFFFHINRISRKTSRKHKTKLSYKMMATDDPTIAANSGSAQKGKLTSWQTEYVLREIEEKNLNRKLFIPQKQLWGKNPEFYGDPASESRRSFGRFISNIVKRNSWQHYADMLMKYDVDMSETTEAALALEIEQEEAEQNDDEKRQDPEEESFVRTRRTAAEHLQFAHHFRNNWALGAGKYLVIMYDEKWFWGFVTRRGAKCCEELGINQQSFKAFHKCHINNQPASKALKHITPTKSW
jgi:hypothetical protein